eukprot:3026111-Rhodomonas_salina.1
MWRSKRGGEVRLESPVTKLSKKSNGQEGQATVTLGDGTEKGSRVGERWLHVVMTHAVTSWRNCTAVGGRSRLLLRERGRGRQDNLRDRPGVGR